MKLALILPKGIISNNPSFVKFYETCREINDVRRHLKGFGLGLLVIAALTPETFEIKLIDENIESIDFNEEYDLIGITAMTRLAPRAYRIADKFREKGVTVVIGGIHATVLPEEVKEHADSVVVGEAEETWPLLIDDFLNKKLKPFYKQKNMTDLSNVPLPKYELLDSIKNKNIWIQTTRGCPHGCEFCVTSKIFGYKHRHKTIDQVVNEISYIKDNFGKARLTFADDNMFVNRKYSKELLKKLIPLNIKWLAQTDISVAEDEELLRLARESGARVFFIGLETINKEGLENIDKNNWKQNQLDKYPEYIKKIQSYGIGVMGAFIVGLDNDDVSVFTDLSKFIIENYLPAVHITVLTPLPGTRLRERLEKEGRLLPTTWDNYTCLDINYRPKKMSVKQLEDGLINTWNKIYSKEVALNKAKYFKKLYAVLIDRENNSI